MKPSEEQPQRIKGQTNNTPIGPLGDISHKRITLFGKRLSVIRLDGEEFLIGVQIASLLKRETFNMYRSMKIKNILIQRANVEQVDFLCKCNAVRTGTHSVTLIPYHSGLYFISEAMSRQKKNGDQLNETMEQTSHSHHHNNHRIILNNNFNNTNNQPKHRRKANRWEVHRSIKQQDLHLLSDCNFVDFNTPFDDVIALAKQQLAKSKLNSSSDRHPHHHLHFALLEKNQSKKKSKSNHNNNNNNNNLNNSNNNINNLLFAAEEDEINSGDSFDNSPSSPLSSLNSSSSSVSNSFPSSPSFSTFNSPQENLFQFLPQFNLGIFSDNNSNNTNIITKELNNNNNQFSVPTF